MITDDNTHCITIEYVKVDNDIGGVAATETEYFLYNMWKLSERTPASF